MIQAIVFDGDDTLWHTEWLYDEARQRAREIVEAAGLDGAAWETRERLIDVENVARFGHGADRFPTSCAEAYEEACEAAGQAVEEEVRAAIGAAARVVFQRRAPLVAGAAETLAALRSRGVRLALLTKGDPSIQRARIEQSGVAKMFDLVEIVEDKGAGSILSVIERLGARPETSLTVGNSVRSDVLPSLAAGVTPVWIDAPVWEYERGQDTPPESGVIKREDLSDVLGIVLG